MSDSRRVEVMEKLGGVDQFSLESLSTSITTCHASNRLSLSTLDESTRESLSDSSSGECWLCVIGDDLREDHAITESAKVLGLQVAYCNEAKVPDEVPGGCNLAFVVAEFEGQLFDRLWSKVKSLRSSQVRILGPPCLHYCAAASVFLPLTRRPIYSLIMSGIGICFMGFRSSEKKDMDNLVIKVRYMGADVRTDVSDVSHVIAPNVTSSRYEKAVALGLPIMSKAWVETCWERRHDLNARAGDCDLMEFRLSPFKDLTLSFFGYNDEDRQEMEIICEQNGGTVMPFGQTCTHIVCSPDVNSDIGALPTEAVAVKSDWFWESIQIRACSNVNLHLFQKSATPMHSPSLRVHHVALPSMSLSVSSPLSSASSSLFAFPSTPRELSVSTSGSSTRQVSTEPASSPTTECAENTAAAKLNKKLAERRNKCIELQETEINYVAILNYIVTRFVGPLESPNQIGGAILNPEEVKEIFYPLPALAAMHEKMLSDLQSCFSALTISDETCFGDILLKHVEDMIRIYPRFINFYEGRQECVLKKSKSNARFMAFMQLRYSEAAKMNGPFSKQKLTELLITPVQRMPRYLLLLEGIIKLTPNEHTDKAPLIQALEGFKTAAQRINDDKRIAEDRILMLGLPKMVEGLPPTTLSSARSIVGVLPNLCLVEGSDSGSVEIPACLIVFNDSVEIAKRRGNLESLSIDDFNSKSDLRQSGKRVLRHIDFFLLAEIKTIMRYYADSESVGTDLFGMAVTSLGTGSLTPNTTTPDEQWIIFRVLGSTAAAAAAPPPANELNQVKPIIDLIVRTRQAVLHTDPEKFVQSVARARLPFLDNGNGDVFPNGLSKAIRGARSKARRVTRAFSKHIH